MWIILLDHSGSMGEPFKGEADFKGRVRTVADSIKLEAAKTELRRHIRGLDAREEIVLIEFTQTASVAFSGKTSDPALDIALDALTAGGNTRVDVALEEARRAAETTAGAFVRVLVISDGLSNVEAATAEAVRLASIVAVIDVLLIDPTPDGETLARAIAVRGTVEGVRSVADLSKSIGTVAATHAALAQEVAAHRQRVIDERRALEVEKPAHEKLRITAGYEASIDTETWSPIYLYLHIPGNQGEVERMLASALESARSVVRAESRVPIARGTILRITPQVEGVDFDPVSQEIAWRENVQLCLFRMRGRGEKVGSIASGVIEITHQLLPILVLPLSVEVVSTAERRGQVKTATASVIDKVFASYAHKNIDVVRACVEVYRALGIYVYLDFDSLRSGQVWESELRKYVDDSDLFQLYWSTASAQSAAVESEWRYALQAAGKTATFVRPMYWEENWPSPPRELAHLHFQRLRIAAGPAAAVATAAPPVTTPAFPVTVLPLIEGTNAEVVSAIRNDVRWATGELERITGLRYYPVPTVLVDDYLVTRVREGTVEEQHPKPPATDLLTAWADFLQRVALEFHVAFRSLREADDIRQKIESSGSQHLTEEQFRQIRSDCEWIIARIVQQAIAPMWRKAAAGDSQTFSAYILSAIDAQLLDANALAASKAMSVFVYSDDAPDVARIVGEVGIAGLRWRGSMSDGKVEGTRASFIEAVRRLRPRLERRLQKYDDYWASTESRSDEVLRSDRALVRTVATLAGDAAQKGPAWSESEIFRICEEVIWPLWRNVRARHMQVNTPGLRDASGAASLLDSFLSHVTACLEDVQRTLGDFEFRTDFHVSDASAQTLGNVLTQFDIKLRPHESMRGESFEPTGPFASVVRAFRSGSKDLVAAMRTFDSLAGGRKQLVVEEAASYGIFIPESAEDPDRKLTEWARNRDLPAEVSLPRTPRVLFCASAAERLRDELETRFGPSMANEPLSEQFRRLVLLHEHFHAIIATGFDARGSQGASRAFPEQWREASSLNEALAAWVELNAVRNEEELCDFMWAYIRTGPFPSWPYAGAESIEQIYKANGLAGVRELITSLRDDPAVAARTFATAAVGDQKGQAPSMTAAAVTGESAPSNR